MDEIVSGFLLTRYDIPMNPEQWRDATHSTCMNFIDKMCVIIKMIDTDATVQLDVSFKTLDELQSMFNVFIYRA